MNTLSWMLIVEELKKAIAARDRKATNDAVTRLLDIPAPLGANWLKFADLMRINGEYSLAHRAMDEFVKATRNDPKAKYSKVVLLTQTGQMQQAFDLLSSLPANVPDPAGHEYVLGNVAMSLGNIDQAKRHLTNAVDLRPGWGPAWLTLSSATKLSEDAELAKQLLSDRKPAQKQGPGDLARYYYALGKMYSDQHKPDETFKAYQRGARLLRKETPYSRKGNATSAKSAMTGFDNDLIEKLNKTVSCQTNRPIFVTGLPRSGTTLVEQILTSHSQVEHGAELNLAQQLAVTVGGTSGEAIESFVSQGKTIEEVAQLYLHLISERFGSAGRVVDKTVDLSRFMGLIATALPEAPLVWMQRDPLDSAWSCFKTFFIHGVGWSYDFEDIAHHFMLENKLLSYWKARLGERLLVIPYKDMVESPEEWIRKLLVHCNLAEEEGVFKPHETKRVVMTASAMQVRKPINREGLKVAEPYTKYMKPFINNYRVD